MNVANQTAEVTSAEGHGAPTEVEIELAKSIIARTGPAEMTQLALDAAQLVRNSTERYEALKDRGFFRRLAGTVTGVNGREARAQLGDMAQLHRIGLVLIDDLQSQSLIEARALTIVRHQLQGVTEATQDNQEMLSRLVDRLGSRLAAIDSDVAMLKWRSELELLQFGAPDRPMHVWLAVVLDLLAVVREQRAEFDAKAVGNSLALAFGRVGLGGRHSVADFVRRLVAEVDGQDPVRIAHRVAVHAAGQLISTADLLDRIPGDGFAALHVTAGELDRLATNAADFELDWGVNAAKISAIVARKLGALETEYSLAELGVEVIAGQLLAEVIFAREVAEETAPPIESAIPLVPLQEDQSLSFSGHVRIDTHAFAESKPTASEAAVYLGALRAHFAGAVPVERQGSYLSAVSDALGRATESDCDSTRAAAAPTVKQLVAVLNTPERRHAWLADGLFLGCENGLISPPVVATFEKAALALDVRSDVVNNLVRNVPVIATSTDPAEILKVGAALNAVSTQWRTFVQFRKLSMGSAFKAATLQSHSLIWEGIKWYIQLSMKSMDLHNKQLNTWALGEEGFLQRAALAVSRKSFIWGLESIFKELGERVGQVEAARKVLNEQLGLFGLPRVGMVEEAPKSLDLDTSYANDKWEEQTEKLLVKMDKCIESLSDVSQAISASAEELVKRYG